MGKKFKKLLAAILSLSILATFCVVPMTASADGKTPLKFGSDGKFKIVVFSDVQENTTDIYGIQRLVDIMKKSIEREKPDLVVFTGDQTEINIKDVQIDFKNLLEQLLAPVVEANVPYSFVFGNHDSQSYYSGQRTDKDEMLKVYQSIGDCRTVDADPSLFGTGTCKIPVYSSDGKSVAVDLFMVDSNTYQDGLDGATGYDNPHDDQMQWVAANKDDGAKSIVFQHIPMPEIYNLVAEDASGEKVYNGKKYKKELVDGVSGALGEFPCPSKDGVKYGEFSILKDMGGVLGVVTGHDHLNDFSGSYDGITMTAIPGMTYYNYGLEEVRGYGVIELNENDLSKYDYHSVKFTALDAAANPYALNVDFSGGNSVEKSGNATAIENTGSTVTYKLDTTLNKMVAVFDGASGYGYTLSDVAREKMQDGYTYEILYKLPSAFGGKTDLASGMYTSGFGTEYVTSRNEIDYWQSFDGDMQDSTAKSYRQLYYGNNSVKTGEWVHLVAVWDPDAREGAGQMIGYLNGSKVDTADPSTKVLKFNQNGEFYIGGNSASDGSFRDGTASEIAFVRIYDKVYSASEVATLHTDALIPGAGASDGKYYPYDEITYADLTKNNVPLNAEGTDIGGGNIFTYDAHSPSYSAKLKFRWTVGTQTGIQFSFDRSGKDSMSYPFGVWVKKPNTNDAGVNGAWHLKPTDKSLLVNMQSKPSNGNTFDIEFGRLKVLDNAPAHGGEYYVYLKVNDTLIQETYTAVDANGNYSSAGTPCKISNEIVFADWNNYGNKISETPGPEEYEDYAEVNYTDFLLGGNPLPSEIKPSSMTFTYNNAKPTGSAIVKYRWIPTSGCEAQFGFDTLGDEGFEYMFGAQIYRPGSNADYPNGYVWLRPGYGPKLGFASPLVAGQAYDIEFARLKVKNGVNAGKYYVYIKIGDNFFLEDYVSAYDIDEDGYYISNPHATTCQISNKFFATSWSGEGSIMTYIPVPETYEDYAEIEYTDLLDGGNPIKSEVHLGTKTLTYNNAKSTGSAILKYRWIPTAGCESQLAFDTLGNEGFEYMFGVQIYKPGNDANYPNGYVWLRPGYGPKLGFSSPLVAGQAYDIEFARLKVKSGANAGKYYVYFKMGNDFFLEDYVAADVVDGSGNYTSAPHSTACTISNKVFITNWGGDGGTMTYIPVAETYDEYDEITFDNLICEGQSMSGREMDGSHNYTYNATSPSYSVKFAFRWTPAGTEDNLRFSTYFDDWVYPFCFAAKTPNQSTFGKTAGPNGAWHLVPSNADLMVDMDKKIVAGQNYDIEIGRLKVTNGVNKGKYYAYFMVNGELIQSYYYDGVSNGVYGNENTPLSNKIIFSSPAGNKFSGIPVVETYETCDEIGYEDLMLNGKALTDTSTTLSGGTTLTYNKTSPTGSVIFKYRWKVGSKSKIQLSFEKTLDGNNDNSIEYMFGAWLSEPDATYTNGKMWLRPGSGPEVNLPSALAVGSLHNVEFARLKVKTGANKGKYKVYIKIDDVLVAEDYTPANVVNNNQYVSNPANRTINISNEIFFAFWGSENNQISAYKEITEGHIGTRGDFDGNGTIGASDLVAIKKILLGAQNLDDLPEGVADFNNDTKVNLCDLLAMTKYIAPINNYARSGNLTLGTQEHLLESNGSFVDNTKTADYIAEASAVLGAESYRLSMPINTLFYARSNNEVGINTTNMNNLKSQVAALKAQGINEILYVTSAFVIPYGYGEENMRHNKTVPDPVSDKENYDEWLKVNANAFKALATEVPEIKFFEPFNEINVTGSRLETYGIGWNATAEEQAAHRFSTEAQAGIMADLCWNISEAVKSVDPANQVTTPSIAISNATTVDNTFMDKFYKAIESGSYPSNKDLADKRVDNFFTIVNIHSYPDFSDKVTSSLTDNWIAKVAASYDTIKAHNDGDSRVWLTETGMSSYHGDGAPRNETTAATVFGNALKKMNTDLKFIDTIFVYKLADISLSNGEKESESGYGVFYAGDDLDHDMYGAKPIAKTIYSFFHNGSTDYTAITNLVKKYNPLA